MVVNDDLATAPPRSWSRSCGTSSTLERLAHARPYTAAPMIKPRVDQLLERTDTHYAAVLVAAKRARQLNSYYRALGEGSYEEFTPPMVETTSGNYLTIALEELAQGKLNYRYRVASRAYCGSSGEARWPASSSASAAASPPTRHWSSPGWRRSAATASAW